MTDTFKTGRSAARRQARKSEAALAKQRQTESVGLAEEDDEIARRKLLASGKEGGRRSLIRTSEAGAGLRENLG